jgi:hypothetical protein
MFEIIALIFLCKRNGILATRKGLKPGAWKFYTVLAWVVAEFIGIGFSIVFFGKTNFIAAIGMGLFSAFGGYLLVKYNLEKRPDSLDNDINNIGIDDLRPPTNQAD